MMTEFFQDAYGNVGKTKFKCMSCYGSGKDVYDDTCFLCGGWGYVCEEEEYTPDERDELDKWVFEE
jgi:DnaJ-class molecular chaperone